MAEVRGVVAHAKGEPVEVTTVIVPDPGPGEAVVKVQTKRPTGMSGSPTTTAAAADLGPLRLLLRDRDTKYSVAFDAVQAEDIDILTNAPAPHLPKQFLFSCR